MAYAEAGAGRELHAGDDLTGRQVDSEQVLKEPVGSHHAPPVGALQVDFGVDRQHDGRVVGRWIRMGQAAAQRAAIADLRIANFTGRVGHARALLAEQRRRGDRVVDRGGADLDLSLVFSDVRERLDPGDIDERLWFTQAKLHQRHKAVPAGDKLGGAIRCRQPLDRIVERGRTRVVEW